MKYILGTQALASLMEIRKEYEQIEKVNLSEKPSFFGTPTMFGGTDIEARNKQITFLENMYYILKEHLKTPEELISEQAYRINLTASQMMMVVALNLKWQVSGTYYLRSEKNSTLVDILDKKLNFTSTNYLDDEDMDLCFEAAEALMALPGAFTEANQTLKAQKKDPFDRSEWKKFHEFIKNQRKPAKKSSSFPITSYTRPIFGTIFGYAGASLGLNAGNTISKSTQLNTTRYYLTAGISGIILTVGGAGTMGVSIIAPVIATKLVESFCQISLGHIGAVTLKLVGEGVGISVGLPLDLTLMFTKKSVTLLKNWLNHKKDMGGLTGIRIADGMPVVAGLVIKVSQNPEDSKELNQPLIVELELSDLVNANGFHLINNDEIIDIYPSANNTNNTNSFVV